MIKKLSKGMKFSIALLIVAMILVTGVGVSNIFAEPTIEDLVPISDFGSFEPNDPYREDDHVALVGWLNVTQIIFSYDWWEDTSGDGEIDVEDVYTQEGFEQELLTGSHMLPIFATDNEDADYYVVSFGDYESYNGVVVEFNLAENNDYARMQDDDTWFFDGARRLLYIDKTVLNEAFEEEFFNSLRAETIMLTKDIETLTKTIDVITLFKEDIENTYGLYDSTPNEAIDVNVRRWLLDGVEYQLVPTNKLAHVSSEDITVFRNGLSTEHASWYYDETSGIMRVFCDPYETDTIIVRFDDVHESTSSQDTLQHFQANFSDTVGQAATIQSVLGQNMENPFLHNVTYRNSPPKTGTFQDLGFFAVVAVDSSGNIFETEWGDYNDGLIKTTKYAIARVTQADGGESLPIGVLKDAIEDNMWRLTKINGHWQSTTLAAWSDGRLVQDSYGNYYFKYDTQDPANGYPHSTRRYGEVVYNLYLARKYNNMSYLEDAMDYAEEYLFTHIDDHNGSDMNSHGSDSLTTSWDVFNPFNHEVYDGRYITGTMKSNFLGGTIEDGDGMAIFDVICARITAPNGAWEGVSTSVYDYKTVATIVDVDEPNSSGQGYMYLCVYSNSMIDEDVIAHTQRVLAFSKVKYTYDGSGNLRLVKRDRETNAAVSGATFTIYDEYGNVRGTIDTEGAPKKSIDLPSGNYYIEETRPAVGYLEDTKRYTFTITGGQTTDLVVYGDKQECEFSMTVYDETTKDNSRPRVLSGITFDLYNPSGARVGTYVTNTNGQLSDPNNNGKTTFRVGATGRYVLKQVDTIEGYAMTGQCNGGTGLVIDATPNRSGEHIIYTQPFAHYESRQEIVIQSQIQDSILQGGALADFGGDETGHVRTTGAAYRLRAKSTLILGYENDGTPITIDSEKILTIYTKDANGNDNYSDFAYSYAQGSKAYLMALGVKDPDTGLTYPLPNGYYQWELVDASEGYYDNGKTTLVDAKWSSNNSNIQSLTIGTPVEQTRQTAAITLYVKSYDYEDRASGQTSITAPEEVIHTIKENAYTSLLPKRVANNSNELPWIKYVNEDILKTVISNKTKIDGGSVEVVTIKNDSDTVLTTLSSNVAKNAVYELINLGDIITVNTGEKVAKGTVLGTYKSGTDGTITINSFGSGAFENPNDSTKSVISTFKAVAPLTVNGNVATGPLPNGVYGLTVVAAPDGYLDEGGMTEDIVVDAKWVPDSSTSEVINVSTATYFYRESTNPQKGLVDVNLAPDAPKQNGGDDYDPNDPDDDRNPDDSNDIPIASKDWIDKNASGVSYRIVDGANVTGEGDALVYEVEDQLPTTFSFYVNNNMALQSGYAYKCDMEFYYEVPQEEYASAEPILKENNEYIIVGDGKYARRFATDGVSGGSLLQDVIVLNRTSPGYISYKEIEEGQVVAGAIHNTEWLNKKLAQQEDGDYSVYVVVRLTISYETKYSEQPIVMTQDKAYIGELKVKNRRMVNLD